MSPNTLSLKSHDAEFWSTVAVVIPAYNEQVLISSTLRGIPKLVGAVIVVDDASTDDTSKEVESLKLPQLQLIKQSTNRGVGAAIMRGYAAALASGYEWIVVMAGDNQMNPVDLPGLLENLKDKTPVYVKGNRLTHQSYQQMPRHRRWGSRLLAKITGWLAGVSIDDAQCGYTAINRAAASLLHFETTWPGYGYPNDLILQLAYRNCTIIERSVEPVYAQEKSGLRLYHFFIILGVIARRLCLEAASTVARKPKCLSERSAHELPENNS